MDLTFSFFLAAGCATLAYTKLGKRIGYGNSQNIWVLTGAVFGISFVVFLILFLTLLHTH